MSLVTVYSPRKSARLTYVLNWLLTDVLNLDYRLTDNENELLNLDCFLAYGKQFEGSISIPDCGLLWEDNITEHEVLTGEWKKTPTLYPASSDYSVPFDFFSAIFFLITRYEEYFPHTPDKHGRYPAQLSLLYQHGFLKRPLVDEWIFEFYSLLKENKINAYLNSFSYQPTYDIDIAYSYKHKGFVRTLGAVTKDILQGNFKNLKSRMSVMQEKHTDPYDAFDWLQETHKALHLAPRYFVLASLKVTPFDKNISPLHPKMQKLIRGFAHEGSIGLHPSYFSTEEKIFFEEKATLENITQQIIHHSRQHYIRLCLPKTYQQLLERGILEDWSMGYGSLLGFRAGTGRSFFWYDLKNEMPTELKIHPFCFMDSTAHFEEKLSQDAAFKVLQEMKFILEKTQSTLVTVFHNFSLGSDPQWNGWKEAYSNFLKSLRK
ncbi:MAG TPA: polysaccharide deacetylase family protein [Flavipsychrobacter sp.]|nr:polysaccharide deacetylase family protein [Flavipsychrobacter sp.]